MITVARLVFHFKTGPLPMIIQWPDKQQLWLVQEAQQQPHRPLEAWVDKGAIGRKWLKYCWSIDLMAQTIYLRETENNL